VSWCSGECCATAGTADAISKVATEADFRRCAASIHVVRVKDRRFYTD
jgi:hypothetical protein